MGRHIIYIEQYINTPSDISILVENIKYNIEIKDTDFGLETHKFFYSNNQVDVCKITGHLVKKKKRKKDRTPSPTPSNIILDIQNNLKLKSNINLPIIYLDYLIVPTNIECKYTRDNPLYVKILINKKIVKKNNIIFWGICICYLIWIFYK